MAIRVVKLKPITVAIPTDALNVSGTQNLELEGIDGEGGTVIVRWQVSRL